MKRFLKISMMIALAMFLAGMLLTVTGRAAGGRGQLSRLITENFLEAFYNNGGSGITFDDTKAIWTDDFSEALSEKPENLDIEAAGILVRIIETEGNRIQIEGRGDDKAQFYVEDDTLYVKAQGKIAFPEGPDSSGEICLYLPSGMRFEKAVVGLGAGEVDMEVLRAGRLDCNVGAGSLNVNRLEADTACLDLGMGEINLYESSLQDLELNVGMGSAYVDGSITGDVTGSCGMGSLIMMLDGKETDHNYAVQSSMGSVVIEGSMSGSAGSWTDDNQAASDFNITCSMGSVEIYFTNSEG